MTDWFFVATLLAIGLIAWVVVALLGGMVIGRAIRVADSAAAAAPSRQGPGEHGAEGHQAEGDESDRHVSEYGI